MIYVFKEQKFNVTNLTLCHLAVFLFILPQVSWTANSLYLFIQLNFVKTQSKVNIEPYLELQ